MCVLRRTFATMAQRWPKEQVVILMNQTKPESEIIEKELLCLSMHVAENSPQWPKEQVVILMNQTKPELEIRGRNFYVCLCMSLKIRHNGPKNKL